MNYTDPDEFKKALVALIEKSHAIGITSHMSPDDDSIGSTLTCTEILHKEFPSKNIKALYTGERPSRYTTFEGFENIEFVDDIANHINEIDLLIVLDGSQYYRFSNAPEKLHAVKNIVCIDHHSSPPDTFTLSYIVPNYSSTSELIYNLAEEPFSTSLASALLLGILGDTGNFTQIKPQQTSVLIAAKKCIEVSGIGIDEFLSRYNTISPRVYELVTVFIKNSTFGSANYWPNFQYTYITSEECAGYSEEEVSNASHIFRSNYFRRISGYPWGFILRPSISQHIVSVSSRSLPKSVNVRVLHEALGIGGGHDRAAGGKFADTLDVQACLKKMLDWLQTHESVLG